MHDHVEHLPFGAPVDRPQFLDWDISPIDGEVRTRALEPPEIPEPPRTGVGGVNFHVCDRPRERNVWADADWTVSTTEGPHATPATLFLEPRDHHDLSDLPPHLAASMGVMITRVERAYRALGGIARVHMYRWGDGAEHLHLWFVGRPEGMLQLRGMAMPIWSTALPPTPRDRWLRNLRTIGAALAAEGGTAYFPGADVI
jgi:diadenosine tetraphosphate (Ap4A) HIT family hydrolase